MKILIGSANIMMCSICSEKMTSEKCLKCSWLSTSDTDLNENISELSRQELEEELIHVQHICRKLNTIIEFSTNPLFVTNGQGDVIKVNASYEKLSGFKRDDLLGRNVSELVGTVMSKSSTLLCIKTQKNATLEQTLLRRGITGVPTSIPIFNGETIEMVISNNWDPDDIDELRIKLETEEKKSQKYLTELELVKEQILDRKEIVARDRSTLDVLYRANKVAGVDSSVLILGETGTGKEEFAKYIHCSSAREKGPFIKVNCGAIAQSIIESELFGYEKGAYTGANTTGKKGLFEIADNGTIFLDEIGELPSDMQVKLLRVLQEQEIMRVGGNTPIKINVRVLSATNRDLKQMMQKKLFREDLYYRLSVVTLEIPPLRDRPDDIVPLTVRFLDTLNKRYNMKRTLTKSAYQILKSYSWPGNVRELKNILEEVVVMSESEKISKNDFAISKEMNESQNRLDEGMPLARIMDDIEYKYMRQAHEKFKSVRKAASYLGISPTTYARRLKVLEQELERS
ncbi:MAG: PAS domain-containing protein [Clostridia bacterium]|nr:PAS domain-containing protein [Clostridia bacterium]